jgi:hypothetical protein
MVRSKRIGFAVQDIRMSEYSKNFVYRVRMRKIKYFSENRSRYSCIESLGMM